MQGFIGELLSGRSFVAQQNGLCGLGFDGASRFNSRARTSGALVVDAADNLYFPTNQGFASADVSGRARWARSLDSVMFPSVALGSRDVFALVQPNDDAARLEHHVERASPGDRAARTPDGQALIDAPRQRCWRVRHRPTGSGGCR